MGYKTISINLNDLDRNNAVVEAATTLAKHFDAHVEGTYVIPAVEIYGGTGFGDGPFIFEGNRDLFRGAEGKVRAMFSDICEAAGVRKNLTVIDSISPRIVDDVVEQAHHADIVVVSQPAAAANAPIIGRDFVEGILLSTGRPTLVLPRTGKIKIPAELALIGWSGTREASRAAFDSIPLLKMIQKVHIVWVDPEKERSLAGSLPGSELALTLSRHDIQAIIEPIATGGREAGEALLTKVTDSGADLLVMGAYGHSRFREFILGGATRSVLSDMRCPVLFSH